MTNRRRYGDLSDDQLYELHRICDQFEKALRTDQALTIENLIADAEVELHRPLFLELLDIQLEARVLNNEKLDANEYLARFPERKTEIESAFQLIADDRKEKSDQETRFHEPSDPNAGDQPTTDHLGIAAGVQIGPYTLVRPIGEGGMGSVWMATQKTPVYRAVALKIIKAGMDTREVIARFEAERQALALMNHPNIAKVLDAGETKQGRPFFAMELVKGSPITKYCDDHHLQARQRLSLFTSVCRAVQHAHQKGIIHRDIKPSNVLVTEHDGQPLVKVIDFGLAKATGQRLTEKTVFTAFGQMVGTPTYMSPEQADIGLEDIDTRTDVYSLGVLLYELLTGVTPIDINQLRSAGFAEMQRIIREQSPVPMSSRISSLGLESQIVATNRDTDSKRLTQLLRGDLDLIVGKALEKERNRRYETPSNFAADIERFLKNEAIEARPPSATYRLSKLIRRNKTAVLTTSAIGLALLGGTIVSLWQASVARDQRDLAVNAQQAESEQRKQADEQRDRAVHAEAETQQRADELQVVAEFQADMLKQIDTNEAGKLLSNDVASRFAQALGKDELPPEELARQIESFSNDWKRVNATDAARNLIDQTILTPAIGAIDKQFKDQPVVDGKLRQTLANLYVNIGLYDAALPLQTAALDKRRNALGVDHPDTIYSITNMGVLWQTMGNLDDAEPYYHESLDQRRKVLGAEHPDTLISINNMGFLLQSQGKLDKAESFYRDALEKRRRVLGENDELTIASINNLAFLLHAQGKFDQAEVFWREALEKSRFVLGEEDPSTLTAINNLGFILRKQNKLDEAVPLHIEALEKRRRILGEEHPETLGSINNLGILRVTQGKLDESEPLFRELLELRRRVLGEDHPSTLASINNLGYVLQQLGKRDEAEPFFQMALEKKLRRLGKEHPSTLGSIINLAGLQIDRQNVVDAEASLREALETCGRVLGGSHPTTLNAQSRLGVLMLDQAKLEEAELLLSDSLTKRKTELAEDHPDTLHSINLMGALEFAKGNHAEALAILTANEEKSRKAFASAKKDRLAQMLMNLGKAQTALASDPDDFIQIEPYLIEANEILTANLRSTPNDVQVSIQSLVDLYDAWDLAEPGKGHDVTSAKWKSKLESIF